MLNDHPGRPDKNKLLDEAAALIAESKRLSQVSQELIERCRDVIDKAATPSDKRPPS